MASASAATARGSPGPLIVSGYARARARDAPAEYPAQQPVMPTQPDVLDGLDGLDEPRARTRGTRWEVGAARGIKAPPVDVRAVAAGSAGVDLLCSVGLRC